MDPKRLFLASLLSLVVVLAWPLIFPVAKPPEGHPAAKPAAGATATVPPGSLTTSSPPAAATTSGAVAAEAAPAAAPATAALPEQPIGETREVTTVLTHDGARAEFSNRGGTLRSFLLPKSGSAVQAVDLVRGRSHGPYVFGLVGDAGVELPVEHELFAVDAGPDSVTYRYRGARGAVTKRFAFDRDGMLTVEISAAGAGPWAVFLGPGLRNLTPEELGSRFERRVGVSAAGSDLETLDAHKVKAPTPVELGGLSWLGLEDTYFLALVVPQQPLASARFVPALVPSPGEATLVAHERELTSAESKQPRELTLFLTPRDGHFAARCYFGPKNYDRLVSLGLGFERTVRWGTWGFLARPLLRGLQWMHAHVVSNYGWAIVLMTIAIKLVLLPLTHKSMVSMQKMQKLNPKVQAIRNAYKGKLRDKNGKFNFEVQQKMNAEIMALYSKEGASPTSGCLPLLLQLPILFAFYNLLSTAIELRGEPWVLWIHDLAAPDPLKVLPIVMGITQFIQTKMTPATGDPMQRRIFLMMPLFFTVLFLGFPSGLVLYWLTNNLLTIAQTAFYNRMRAREEAAS